ncbi:Folylpolyglutamate synthetase [Paraconiothyrium brasiliense]|uniref:Folylpolyglutamate synthetase n=1 Tax=Paraconiothyrium brasiliense TaxID=300254 RepID=A0ABR3RUP3_9PLEO
MDLRFKYNPLNVERHEIRLLKLLSPGSGPSPAKSALVNCTLEHVSLDEIPEYQALSYVWGNPALTSPICVDGQIFEATFNLEAALRHLRKKDASVTLWVDAVCIDQSNNVEKSDQVQRMGDIYRNASEVVIWLGQTKQEHSKLWAQLKELSHLSAGTGALELNIDHLVDVDGKETRAPWLLGLNLELQKVFETITIGYSDEDTLLIEPLLKLLMQPWWSRIWVVQEASLAMPARVVWGSNEMYWGELWSALGYIATWLHFQSIHLMGDESYHKAFFSLERSQQFWVPLVGAWERVNRRSDDKKVKLIDMLLQTSVTSALTATDPRDRIYGLFGIVEDADELGIKVDYSQSVESIYEGVARALLRTEGLKMLQCCQYSARHRSGTLPSWVPDWSSSLRQLLDGLRILLPSGVYNASGLIDAREARELEKLKQRIGKLNFQDSPLSSQVSLSPDDSAATTLASEESKPGILPILAARVDSILAVGGAWEEANDAIDGHIRDMLWVEELEQLAEKSKGVYSEAAKDEALWRTPIADRGLPRLTYIWFTRATTEAMGHDVLMGRFPLDKIEEASRSFYYQKSRAYQKILRAFGKGRRFFVTQTGYLGLGPDSVEAGDEVYIISGASIPFVLRPTGGSRSYKIIGETYVHGIMDGEFMQKRPEMTTVDLC